MKIICSGKRNYMDVYPIYVVLRFRLRLDTLSMPANFLLLLYCVTQVPDFLTDDIFLTSFPYK